MIVNEETRNQDVQAHEAASETSAFKETTEATEAKNTTADLESVDREKKDPFADTPPEVPLLLAKIRSGDSEAFTVLCRLYTPLLDSMTRQFAPSMGITETTIGKGGLGLEELRQDASMALYKAAQRYDPDGAEKGKAVSFGLYAKICIRNALISVLRRAKRQERRWERERKADAQSDAFSERLPEDAIAPFRDVLSKFEYTVFALYITGKPPREISAEVGKSEKSVSNAIYRSKTKIIGMLAKKKGNGSQNGMFPAK